MFAIQTGFVKNKNGRSKILVRAYSADETRCACFAQLPAQVRTIRKPMFTLGQSGQA
jgi:hypothetical protein